MKHIKHHPINDKAQKLSKDMKKQDLIRPKKDKKLPLEDSLSDPTISKRVSKPSRKKKLSGESHLSTDAGRIKKVNEMNSEFDAAKVAKDFLEFVYDTGGMDDYVYQEELSSLGEVIDEFINNITDENSVKIALLDHLQDVGAISGDVYHTIKSEEGL
jgi:hypothetical protein